MKILYSLARWTAAASILVSPFSSPSNVAFASESQTSVASASASNVYPPLPQDRVDFPYKKLVGTPHEKEINEFLQELQFYGNFFDRNKDAETESVTFFWTPRLRMDPTVPASYSDVTDAIALNKTINDAIDQLLKVETTDLAASTLSPAAVSRDNDVMATYDLVQQGSPTLQRNADALGAGPADASAAGDQMDSIYKKISARSWNDFTSIVDLSVMRYSPAVPVSDDSRTNMKYTISKIKSAVQRDLELNIISGFTSEEIALFNEYRVLYPNIKWVGLKSPSVPVTVDFQSITNSAYKDKDGKPQPPTALDQSILGLNFVSFGEINIPLSGAVVEIPITGSGVSRMQVEFASKAPILLPLQFKQTINVSVPLHAKVTCSFKYLLDGDISVSAIKNSNNDVFLPVIDAPKNGEVNSSLCRIETDSATDPLFDKLSTQEKNLTYRAALKLIEEKYRAEFTTRVEASNSLRDQIIAQLENGVESDFTRAIPEVLHSRFVNAFTTQCRQWVSSHCSSEFLGMCLSTQTDVHNECHDLQQVIQEFYVVRTPVDIVKSTVFDASINYDRTFDYNDIYNPPLSLNLNGNICLKAGPSAARPLEQCVGPSERLSAIANFHDESVSGQLVNPHSAATSPHTPAPGDLN